MNKKIILKSVVFVLLFVVALIVYTLWSSNQSDDVIDSYSTKETTGDLSAIKENESVDDNVRKLELGMSPVDVEKTLNVAPTETKDLKSSDNYDLYQKYNLDDKNDYLIYYKDNKLVGVSVVIK